MVLYSVAEGEHKDGVCHQSEAKVERWSARMMLTSLCPRKVFEQELELLFNIHKYTGHLYRTPFCVAWAQLPLGEASGKRGLAHRTHTHR